jgi:hypothetical protein
VFLKNGTTTLQQIEQKGMRNFAICNVCAIAKKMQIPCYLPLAQPIEGFVVNVGRLLSKEAPSTCM